MTTIAETRRKAQSYVEDTGDQVADWLDAAMDNLQSLSDRLGRQGGRQVARARKAATELSHDADSTVRANPYAAIGAALTLGVLMGILLSRR